VYENYDQWFMSHDAWAHAHSNEEYQYTAAHSMLGKIQVVALYESMICCMRQNISMLSIWLPKMVMDMMGNDTLLTMLFGFAWAKSETQFQKVVQ
jgi:hypothetical protein